MPYKALARTKWASPQMREGYTPKEIVPILGTEHFSGKKIRRLLRAGTIIGKQFFKRWHVTPENLEKYVTRVEKEQA